MSESVAWRHFAPAGKHHPAAKWSLLMVLLAVVVLGAPNRAVASPPSVQSPTGPQSGGVFTGTFTFGTYISCSGGYDFSSSYSNSLDGTHTFAFWGAADGSLLVSIDGGGRQLLTSCGDPFTGPNVNVANYTVSKNTGPPPTPTPTPPPTPAPTPTPTPPPSGGGSTGGGSSGGGSGGSSSGGSTSGSSGGAGASSGSSSNNASSAGTAAGGTSAQPDASALPAGSTPLPQVTASGASPTPRPGISSANRPGAAAATSPSPAVPVLALAGAGFGGLLLLGLILVLWRSRRARAALETAWRRVSFRLEPYAFRLRQKLRPRWKIHALGEPRRRGFSHHQHTGKVIAHHHTSYPALAFLLLISGVLTAAVSMSSHADSQLSLTVLGPPPAVAATIDQPLDAERITVATQTVRGTCPLGLMVEIYRNGAFAGSTICDAGGLYSLMITLVPGQNDLIARDLDGLSQYGPDSATVTVFYDAPVPTPTPTPAPTATPAPATGSGSAATPKPKATATPKPAAKPRATPVPVPAPFFLESPTHFFQAADPSVAVDLNVRIHGGSGPYQVSWIWGDGHQDSAVSDHEGLIIGSHRYDRPGAYHITVRVRDASNREAVISLLAIINGATPGGITRPYEPGGNLILIWPTLVVMSLLVGSFWLGERHKYATEPRVAI